MSPSSLSSTGPSPLVADHRERRRRPPAATTTVKEEVAAAVATATATAALEGNSDMEGNSTNHIDPILRGAAAGATAKRTVAEEDEAGGGATTAPAAAATATAAAAAATRKRGSVDDDDDDNDEDRGALEHVLFNVVRFSRRSRVARAFEATLVNGVDQLCYLEYQFFEDVFPPRGADGNGDKESSGDGLGGGFGGVKEPGDDAGPGDSAAALVEARNLATLKLFRAHKKGATGSSSYPTSAGWRSVTAEEFDAFKEEVLQREREAQVGARCAARERRARQTARAFVESIMGDVAEPIPDSDGMSVLRDVVKLERGTTKSVVVIRRVTIPFWQACIDTAETPGRQHRVCAVGTPGIGKTSATPLLIKMLLELRKTVVYLVRTQDKDGYYYEFIPGPEKGDPVSVNVYPEETKRPAIPSLDDPSTYYVVDSGKTRDNCDPPTTFQPKVIIVTSPDSKHWGGEEFTKTRDDVDGKLRIFPVWELEELLHARPFLGKELDSKEVERRYYEVVGVPRHVFEDAESYAEILAKQDLVLTLLSNEERDKMITQGVDSVSTFDESLPTSALIAYRVCDGTFSTYRVCFVGPRVETIVKNP